MSEFKVPELGENVAGGDVTKVLVNVGDTIAREQPVLELETDKATIEVPSSVAGVVKEIRVKKGDKIKVGAVVLTVDAPSSSNGGGGCRALPRPQSPHPRLRQPPRRLLHHRRRRRSCRCRRGPPTPLRASPSAAQGSRRRGSCSGTHRGPGASRRRTRRPCLAGRAPPRA